jgi:hypothetical protein
MHRLPIQLDEKSYTLLKRRAFKENRSIASLVRESVSKFVKNEPQRSAADFPFVASGRSRQDSRSPVSEKHDHALAQAIGKHRRRS